MDRLYGLQRVGVAGLETVYTESEKGKSIEISGFQTILARAARVVFVAHTSFLVYDSISLRSLSE